MFAMSEPNGEEREGRVLRKIPGDTFAHRLMLARSEAGHLSIQQAATRCGLKHQSWSNWERGMEPRGDKVEIASLIADGLDTDREWLLFGGALTQTGRVRVIHGLNESYARRLRSRRGLRRSGDRPMGIRRPRRLDRRVAA
jgi:transcriptional regulator with XRE-family HTH domain